VRSRVAARCVVETGTATFYRMLSELSREPVLKHLAAEISADELRHYKLSLLKNMFGLRSERPPMASGNSLLVEWRLGRGCDLAILVGLRMP
jgi:hypothetical protein